MQLMARSAGTSPQSRQRRRGPSRFFGRGEVLLSLTYAGTAVHSVGYVKDLPEPYGAILFGVCIAAIIFGFGWGAFRLVKPRQLAP